MAKAEKVAQKPGYDTSDVVLTLTSDEAILVRTLVGHLSGGVSVPPLADTIYCALGKAGVGLLPEDVFISNSNGRLNPCIKRMNPELHKQPGFHI